MVRRNSAARQGAASLRQGAGKGRRLPCDGMPNSPLRAMLIEDDAVLADGLARALEGEGLQVERCASGGEALRALAAAPCDLVVLDLGLPDMDGLELLARLRARGQELPVLLLTARDPAEFRARGQALGAHDYLAKPCALPEFLGRARAALLRAGAIMRARMRILIVEDDAALADGLARILRAEGYAVDVAPRGELATHAAAGERFD